MKQSPIRKLRRDRTRLMQDLSLARAAGDADKASEIESRIKELDRQIAALGADNAQKRGT
jgi:hypothetical protein